MTLQKDIDRTNSLLSPVALEWVNLSSSANLSTICSNVQRPTLVYLHSKKMSQGQLWESCRWRQTGPFTWKKMHLLMSLGPSGKQHWELVVTTYSTTGAQLRQTTCFRESGTWLRLSTADTSSSTTCRSSYRLKRTAMNGRRLMR